MRSRLRKFKAKKKNLVPSAALYFAEKRISLAA